MTTDPSAPLVWIDVETTGLSVENDQLLEIAVVITDGDLVEQADCSAVIWHSSLAPMNDHVMEMHARNGLLAEIKDGLGCWKIASDLKRMFQDCHVTKLSPLCGSTVSFDRGFFAEHFPDLNKQISYRNVDVSTIKELVARWQPNSLYKKGDVHRALPDVYDSINELRHYRGELGL